jgi:hypothetical protein
VRANFRITVGALCGLAALAAAPRATAGGLAAGTDLELKDGKARVQGKLSTDDAKDRVRAASYCQIFKVKLTEGRSYQIDMRSKDLDAYLRLEDADGKQLAQDDDSGGNLNARIRFKCPRDGTYRIIATTYRSGAVGAYELTVQDQDVKVAPGALQLRDGRLEVNASLTVRDARDRVRIKSRCKVYPVQLTGGKTYRIDMRSGKVDSYLRLEDADGKQLAFDDDGGGNLNARITFRCPNDGVYRIIATTYRTQTGPFTLTVVEEP